MNSSKANPTSSHPHLPTEENVREIFPSQWRLSKIQLVNWGTFHGLVTIPVHRKGYLITGGSGSGKSTLIDAISAVLVSTEKLKFNAAAQHETKRGRGRDLVSYIRGAWRTKEDLHSGGIVSEYLRTNATYSIIVLSFSNGAGLVRSAVALFFLRGGAHAQSDVSKFFGVFPEGEANAEDFIALLKRGIDKRAIKKQFPQATFSEKHSVFSAKFRPLVGISSLEVLLLLQRTQSAKSLDSLDQLFRDYMLAVPETFTHAAEAVEQFAELETAYAHVQDIKAQIEHLEPLKKLHHNATRTAQSLSTCEQLIHALPHVETQLKRVELHNELTIAQAEADIAEAALEQARTAEKFAEENYRHAQNALQQHSQGEIAVLHEQLKSRQRDLHHCTHARNTLATTIAPLTPITPDTPESFYELLGSARAIIADYHHIHKALEEQHHNAIVETRQARDTRTQCEDNLSAIAASTSNISARYQKLREKLCTSLQLDPTQLPYIGELIDINPEHRKWEPVIQRTLYNFAQQLLVPHQLYPQVADYINTTPLNLRLNFHSIEPTQDFPTKRTGANSLVRKINVIDHPMKAWLDSELARRFDYQCVATRAELDQLPAHLKGVTIDGLMRFASTQQGAYSYLKDDRSPLGAKSHYQLGSSNMDKVELLRTELQHARAAEQHALQHQHHIAAKITQERKNYDAALAIKNTRWENIDVDSVEKQVEHIKAQIEHRTSTPEAAQLLSAERSAAHALETAKKQVATHHEERGKYSSIVAELTTTLEELNQRTCEDVPEQIDKRLREEFNAHTRRITSRNIGDISRTLLHHYNEERDTLRTRQHTLNNQMSTIIGRYIERWPSEKAELEASEDYVPDALNKLNTLTSDRLAEFSHKFRDLINDMSTHSLTHISNLLRRARAEIIERITPVNHSLATSEFSEGRFLRIDVRDNRGETVQEFQRMLDDAISGGLSEQSEAQAEERYHKINSLITKLGSKESGDIRWQRTVLDTRRHVSFIGCEITESGEVVNTYVDSSALSGGQAQKLVFFCLAAALRYQLARTDAHYPDYATVILDEAFDRADPTYTRRAMNVFAAFGFHMILATPLKLISTLSPFVGGTSVVSYQETPNDKGIVRGQSTISKIELSCPE
ncbi:ATP-binding protein [Corynebacterium felinum]|uniref:Uncharacterized protein YPO0396 n=1 Tax=Corynebacterium felinum TaxID=131318 RepID=A0ABU2BBL4_9CORY|nr:ATP-binding protein [Corynebacterium felinum]MDF5819831.1 ATP-binding protein [Corynebacterium felinum]MDR7356027.1 uncharacterized protein YPO0396 [Corynebacterium felinum]WJY95362.1 Chromosome partition protein Smc [Corynebacterium felinum]